MSPADSPFAQLPAPGPHPDTAELRAYAAGSLAPAEEHRIEAHTLDCERCADLVEGFSMTDAATTEQAVTQLRTRLQARVGTPEPMPVAPQWAWPRLAAAAALLAVVGGGIWGWQHQDTAPTPTVARQESVAPAAPVAPVEPPAPAAEAKPEAAVATLPEPAAPTAAPSKPADYAAVRRPVRRRATKRAAPPAAARPTKVDYGYAAANVAMEKQASSKAVVAPEDAASQPAAAPVMASAPTLAEAVSDKQAQDKANFPDTAAAQPTGAVYARKAKAKMDANALANTARVANTPMPAAFSINPAPVGGMSAFKDYLRREAMKFEPEKDGHISGTVRLQFIVGADGQVSNVKVVRGMRADYDAEALRLVCEGPKWQPGISGGRRAPLPVEIGVSF